MEETSPQEELIDLGIIGGGPAGTAAALEARRRSLHVMICERDRFPRDKVCGEFLSAESLPLLEQEIPSVLARGATIRSAEFISPLGGVYGFALPRAARGLSRRLLDEALWRAAAARGAQTWEGEAVCRLRKLEPGGRKKGGWSIRFARGNTQRTRKLLVACGRWWALEEFPSPARQGKSAAGPWLGAKAHFRGMGFRDVVEMYFFPGGYCGLAPIEDGLYNACCLVHSSLARDFARLADFAGWLTRLTRHPALEARLRGAIQASPTLATAPVKPARRRPDHEGALLAGDAAGFLDPFTGDGISMALHAGRLAAEVLSQAQVEHSFEEGTVPEWAVRRYRQHLGRAVRRSYWVSGLVRVLVRAPASVQAVAATAVPWLGARLLAQTRWR